MVRDTEKPAYSIALDQAKHIAEARGEVKGNILLMGNLHIANLEYNS